MNKKKIVLGSIFMEREYYPFYYAQYFYNSNVFPSYQSFSLYDCKTTNLVGLFTAHTYDSEYLEFKPDCDYYYSSGYSDG